MSDKSLWWARVDMDLYRYFHPHHNPRLQKTPVRLQELAELEQAAVELTKAVKRAEIRTAHAPVDPLRERHFSEVLRALHYVVESLSELTGAHPGDDLKTMLELVRERKDAPGWENWTELLRQRLKLMKECELADLYGNRNELEEVEAAVSCGEG